MSEHEQMGSFLFFLTAQGEQIFGWYRGHI